MMRAKLKSSRLITVVVIVALAVVLFTALGSAPARAARTARSAPVVAWHRCPASSATARAAGFLCATVTAPLDDRDPSGTKIKLAVVEGLPGTKAIPAELTFFPSSCSVTTTL
jgi:hypothetical protein